MGSKKTIIDIRAGNRASAQLARQRTRQGFRYTNRIDESIYGNLTTNISGNTARMTVEQDRLASSLKRLKANQVRGSNRISRGSIADVQNAYGSAVAGGNALNARTVQVTGRAGSKLVGAQAAAGGIVARGNEAAASTLASGVQLARAGAKGQVADALAYRARNDAALAAQNDLALKTMILQNKLDLENYAAKLKMADKAAGTNGQMQAVATSAASAAPGLFTLLGWTHADGSPAIGSLKEGKDGQMVDTNGDPVQKLNAGAAAAAYVANNGLTDPGEIAVVSAIATALYQAGAGQAPGRYTGSPKDLVNAVNQRMAVLYPNFAKYQDTIDAYIRSSFVGLKLTETEREGLTQGGQPGAEQDHGWLVSLGQMMSGQ